MATGIVRRYEDGPPVTLGDPAYITQSILDRAEEIAEREGWRGPGRFGMRHLKKARGQFGDGERAAERGLVGAPERPQSERAATHQDQLAASYVKTGRAKTLQQAHRMATAAAPQIAGRAGVHPDLVVGADLLGQVSVRPPKLSDAQAKLKNLTEQDVVELLVAAPRGRLVEWLPFLRAWCRLTWPPPRAGQIGEGRGPGTPGDPHNREQERIWQAARQERLRRFGYTD